MSRTEKFKLEDLIITADDGSYLVQVERNEEGPSTHSIQDLPIWIFQSRYAIWLMDGDAPIRVRAMEGEQVKQILIRQLEL